MLTSHAQVVLAGVLGAIVGFAAAVLWLARGAAPETAVDASMALRPSSGAAELERASTAAGASPSVSENVGGAGGMADTVARVPNDARLRGLRAREQAAQAQLSMARQRLAQLERELEGERPAPPKRDRREFDLTKDDWKELAAQGVMKYRLPCEGPSPSDDVLDKLGVSPDERDVTRRAWDNSATRLHDAILPLCAAALGGRMEVAQEMSTDSCRQVILSTASDRSESKAGSAKGVASFMAGDAPRPDENSPITERMFLVLAEEAKLLEAELAEAFGPEEAHRLIFSTSSALRPRRTSTVDRPSRAVNSLAHARKMIHADCTRSARR